MKDIIETNLDFLKQETTQEINKTIKGLLNNKAIEKEDIINNALTIAFLLFEQKKYQEAYLFFNEIYKKYNKELFQSEDLIASYDTIIENYVITIYNTNNTFSKIIKVLTKYETYKVTNFDNAFVENIVRHILNNKKLNIQLLEFYLEKLDESQLKKLIDDDNGKNLLIYANYFRKCYYYDDNSWINVAKKALTLQEKNNYAKKEIALLLANKLYELNIDESYDYLKKAYDYSETTKLLLTLINHDDKYIIVEKENNNYLDLSLYTIFFDFQKSFELLKNHDLDWNANHLNNMLVLLMILLDNNLEISPFIKKVLDVVKFDDDCKIELRKELKQSIYVSLSKWKAKSSLDNKDKEAIYLQIKETIKYRLNHILELKYEKFYKEIIYFLYAFDCLSFYLNKSKKNDFIDFYYEKYNDDELFTQYIEKLKWINEK